MKIKKLSLLIPLIGLLASCTFPTNNSSSGSSLNSSTSGEESSSSSSSSGNGGSQSFNERVSNMVSTGITPRIGDANVPETASYDETAVLGSAEHPLLNQPTSDYLEIIAFEQPEQYGDAILIKLGNAEIIVDVGNSYSTSFDDGTNYGEYIKQQYNAYISDQTLELMVVSHPHSDHIGGMNAFVASNTTKIDMLVDHGYRYNGSDNYYYNQIRSKMSSTWGGIYHPIYDCVHNLNEGLARTYITQELFIDWIDTGFYQSNPDLSSSNLKYNGETISDLNITSVAGILSYRSFSCFLDGDMQNSTSYGSIDGENNMVSLNSDNDLFHNVTMLKVAHHGSTTGTYAPLLNALKPSLGFISAGRVESTNAYGNFLGACSGHPHAATLQRLKTANVKTYLNAASGTLHFVTDGSLSNSVYFAGSPLKSSLLGGRNGNGNSLNSPYGSITDMYSDLWNSNFYNKCHA